MQSILEFPANPQSTDVRVGFGSTLPTRSQMQDIGEEIYGVIAKWTKKQVLTTMGVLNAYLYRAAIDTLSLKKDGNRHKTTHRLKTIARQGVECFNITQQAICTYLKDHWVGAASGRTTMWKVRDMLADVFGIFSYQKQYFHPSGTKRGTAPDIENFDMVKALILYEALEHFYCWRWHANLDDLPKHRGAIVRLLFNAVFQGVTRYRRKTDKVVEPVVDPKYIAVYWENGISYNIFGEICLGDGESVAASESELDARSPNLENTELI
jgi:hypothetical protein